MKLIMENWRAYCALVEQKQYSFYERDYDKNPLTDEELKILDQDDDEGLNARAEILAHISDFNELPDFSPSVGEKNLGLSIHNKISDLAKQQKKDSEESQLTKQPEEQKRSSFENYTYEEGSSDPLCLGHSRDPVTGKERDPTNPNCSQEELNRQSWKNLFMNYCFQKPQSGSPRVDISFCVARINNNSYKDLFYEILDSSGNKVSKSDLFEQIVKAQMGHTTRIDDDGVEVGLIDNNGTLGYRAVWDKLDEPSVGYKRQYRFSPIPSHLISQNEKNEILAKGRQPSATILIPRLDPDGNPYNLKLVQKRGNSATPKLGLIVINKDLQHGLGSRHHVNIPTTTISVTTDLPDIEIESSEQYIDLMKSSMYGLKIREMRSGMLSYQKDNFSKLLHNVMYKG